MTKADDNRFTTESQLASRYTGDIATFWQQGKFAEFVGIKGSRINYATFVHRTTNNSDHNAKHKNLIISSGRSEGYLKYKELSYDLFSLGYNIFLLDHRGQGLSDRALDNRHKGYVEDFQYYVDDLATFIEHIVQPHCNFEGNFHKPYLLAHSMGGAISARYLQDYPDSIQAAVLSSPMFGFNSGGVPTAIAQSLITITAKLNHWFDDTPWYFLGQQDHTETEFTNNRLTHSPLRFQQFSELYTQTPALQLGGVTVKWLTESLTALETIFAKVDKITTPTLVIQAGADKIVSNQAQNEFCQQLHQVQVKSCPAGKPLVIKGAYHELFFESDIYRQQALTATIEWFELH